MRVAHVANPRARMLFADDAVLATTHTQEALQRLIDCFSRSRKDFSLTISIKKTNVSAEDVNQHWRPHHAGGGWVHLSWLHHLHEPVPWHLNQQVQKKKLQPPWQNWPNGCEKQPPHAKHQARCVSAKHASSARSSMAVRHGPPACIRNVNSTPITCAAWGVSWISSGRTT